ncbi:MAG: hypothetical protein M3O35_02855 [Acidobacteriota bacterium]|nr:hypothetical protein [Acidobacteriota bacterium]
MKPVSLALLLSTLLSAQPFPPSLFDGLQWRLIGPFRGGRSVAVTGIPGDPTTFYFGSVGGGIWKTTNTGVTWAPIFDSQPIASIGTLALAPSDPNVIYAGTGEADIRSDLSTGDGIYKSTDAGKTWKHAGLRDSRHIARIVVDPANPDIVYVAALGHAYGPNADRGVFRSNNGGATWKKILDKGSDVGAADLALDGQTIYATMWRARRSTWSQYAPLAGPGSGLYKSMDNGDHWTQLTGNGLPESEWGRAGVAIVQGTQGKRVYAIVDAAAAAGGLYRSDDAGASWTRTNGDARNYSRGWYFGGITVDPNNPDVVYLPNVSIYKSSDGGKTFMVLKGAPGGDDYHSLWIDPTHSARMILGSDQGASISVDSGTTWSSWYNQPTAQFYHVTTDNQFPYNVYGSQQDSGTAAVPSRTNHGQITERDFSSVGGAESGYIAVDPKDPNILYVSNTYGTLTRFDKRTAQGQVITPWPASGFGLEISQRKFRFPWTAPLIFSPLEPNTLYYGSQYVLKTTDGGLKWDQISPDLTGYDKSAVSAGPVTVDNAKARGYGVIYSIAPSSVHKDVVWAGTDTGMIHVTESGGRTWRNITPETLTDWSKVTHMEASHFDVRAAYAAVDRHRLDDYGPYLYRTRDFGATWTLATNGIPDRAFLNAIREDPERRGLLYAATEMGVYVSFDDADHWQPLQLNLPVTSVRDLVVHGDDLVIATHGRAFWILDDIAPLRQIDPKIAASDVVLYRPAKAIRMNSEGFQGTPLPPEIPTAKNPPDGAIVDYYLKSAPSDAVTIEILDSANQLVRRIASTDKDPPPSRRELTVSDVWIPPAPRVGAKQGMNRFVWDLRYALSAEGENEPGSARARGPQVLPGNYQVRLTVSGKAYTQPLVVSLDPRSTATPEDLASQLELGLKATQEIARAGVLLRSVRARQAPKIETAITAVIADFAAVLGVVDSSDRRPPMQAYDLFEQARIALEALSAR